MYKGKSVSLVFPAYNEAPNIKSAIKTFKKLNIFDEIIVVDNNSRDKTGEIAIKEKAKVIKETKQGYGFAVRRGLKVAKGEYIVLCEPDGTFLAKDCLRLLENLKDFDFVTGTRTTPKFISPDAHMTWVLQNGNYILAKIIQILFKTPSISDCGCSYKAMKKTVVKSILPNLTVGGSYLLPELFINVVLKNFKVKEIPVNYCKRVGQSKITGSLKKSLGVGVKMILIISKYFFFPKLYSRSHV